MPRKKKTEIERLSSEFERYIISLIVSGVGIYHDRYGTFIDDDLLMIKANKKTNLPQETLTEIKAILDKKGFFNYFEDELNEEDIYA